MAIPEANQSVRIQDFVHTASTVLAKSYEDQMTLAL